MGGGENTRKDLGCGGSCRGGKGPRTHGIPSVSWGNEEDWDAGIGQPAPASSPLSVVRQ